MQLTGRRLPIALLLAGIPWWLGTVGMGFLSDDFSNLVKFAVPEWDQVLQWFRQEFSGYYRPVTALAWKTGESLWGTSPAAYRAANIGLHVVNAALVARLALALELRPWAAFFAGLVFLYQPNHSFAVLNISAVNVQLSTLGVLSAVLLTTSPDARTRTTAFAPALLGMLAKETAMVAPVLVALLPLTGGRWSEIPRRIWPVALALAVYVGLRFALFGHLPTGSAAHSNLHPVNLTVNAAAYVSGSTLPWDLGLLKPLARGHRVTLAGVLTIAVVAAVVILLRRSAFLTRVHWACLLWIAVAILPVVRLYSPWNGYLASAGGSLLAGAVLMGPSDVSRFRACVAAAFVAVCLASTAGQAVRWQQSSAYVDRTLDLLLNTACTGSGGRVLLPTLVADAGPAPAFGGPWGLADALTFSQCNSSIESLTYVHHRSPDGEVLATPQGRDLKLETVTAGSFFRVGHILPVSRLASDLPHSDLTAAGYDMTILRMGPEGRPTAVKIRLESAEMATQVARRGSTGR
jgi:hypothetical protein